MQYVGEPIPLNWSTTNGATWVTPTTVTLTVTTPSGVVVDVPVTSPWVGRHQADYTPTEPGRHSYLWLATGPGAGAAQDVFNVTDPRPMALCSLDDFKRHLNMSTTAVDDDELRTHLAAATLAVERHRAEVVAARPFTDRVDGRNRMRLLLSRHPVISLTSIVTVGGDTSYPVEDWQLNGITGLITTTSPLAGDVDVTYHAGYKVVPETFVLAAQIIAAHLWETQRNSPTAGPALGEGEFLTPSGLGYAIPNRAVELLGGRPPVVA